MEKHKYYFGYKDKIYWVWLTDSHFKLLGLKNQQELTHEEYERVKHFLNNEKKWTEEEKSEKE